ncbi:MAG: LysR family transcriptional regulator substrate-binding protein [Microbacterium sp.]|uniref:LysR family transcriptional regulator substrate-binding protein n=1 Tax=Microbacterium sp. TaxID=51671 RepID=UPI001ACC3FDB|nr:LysR family transcriptional regulator substrate-binding protein [Microbacterium sp.]MBN9177673.1 LysR family transcriptional regulator substrate-binding protein [Microbacterium sp.]
MAGRSAAGRPGPGRPRRQSGAGAASRARTSKPAPSAKKPAPPRSQQQPAPQSALPPGPFRLGAIEGATPGKWIDVWKTRYSGVPLELVPLGMDDQRAAVASASVDAALVRLPIDRAGLHAITLYDEVPVVVCGADSHLTAADELTLADLAGEVVITPAHPPLTVDVPGAVAPRFAPPATVEEAVATAATGVGVVIVPMSLARLHHRKDAAHRPLTDGPLSTVALVWPGDGPTPPLVDAFIGIVRGRTANSSR